MKNNEREEERKKQTEIAQKQDKENCKHPF